MQYVYVLINTAGQFYTGCTNNLSRRIDQHNSKQSTYTKSRGPYSLIYYEACINCKDAYCHEKYLKSGMGKRYLKNRLKRYIDEANEIHPVRTQATMKINQTAEELTQLQTSTNNVSGSEFSGNASR